MSAIASPRDATVIGYFPVVQDLVCHAVDDKSPSSDVRYVTSHQRSILTRNGCHPRVDVPSAPPSEHWLAFVDPKGSDYAESPAAFGISFQHWEP